MEDEKIIELYFARDEAAIKETAAKYGSYCSSISRNILKNDSDAEECVNDTYWHAWNSIPPTRPTYLMAYLGRIVRNISLNVFKSKHAKKRGSGENELIFDELTHMIPSTDNVEDIYEGIALKDVLNRWLSTLSHEQRLIFIGRYWYFEPIALISAKVGCSESKTKMILLRLRNRLREYLESEEIHI